MAANLISMSILKQIFRLRLQGSPIKEIARQSGTSKNTVKKYLALAAHKPLSEWLQMEEMDIACLLSEKPDLSAPDSSAADRYALLEAQKEYLLGELGKKHVTRYLLWCEYKEQNPDGYAYTQFCFHLQQWSRSAKGSMHFEHEPAEKMYVDFAGDTLCTVCPDSGQITQHQVFVAILGYSQYTYLEAIPSQKLEEVLRVCENALRFFSGSPKAIVPDNLKAIVSKADRYEPTLNQTFADFANHYQLVVLPARPYKPKDKALVEGAVRISYQRIFAPLRNRKFFSLPDLNTAIREQLQIHHQTPFQQDKSQSRQSRFEAEKPLLTALPWEGYYFKRYARLQVLRNGHVCIEKHYYSVPYRYIGQKVKICFTQKDVRVYHDLRQVAFHERNLRPHGYSTQAAHLSSTHRYYSEWNEDFFLAQARRIDGYLSTPCLEIYLQGLIKSKKYPEQAYKSCQGILMLSRKAEQQPLYSTQLVRAVLKATELGVYNYGFLKRILAYPAPAETEEAAKRKKTPLHENIRGAEAYQ
jgi:transposase